MNHRGITIVKVFVDRADCRPPREGEGTQWVTTTKRVHVGYDWSPRCTKYGSSYYDTIDQVKDSIDRILNKIMASGMSEKEAVKLFKEC